jgi:hypothetical protein
MEVFVCQSNGGEGATRPGRLRDRPWRAAPAPAGQARPEKRELGGGAGRGRAVARGVGGHGLESRQEPPKEEEGGKKKGKRKRRKKEKKKGKKKKENRKKGK